MTDVKNELVEYVGKADETQLEQWKKEFGEVRVIEIIESPTKISVGYVRKPNRTHIARAMVFVNSTQMVEAGESLLDDTWLGGDPRILSIEDKDTDFRVAAAMALSAQTKILDASIKNV